MSLYKRTHAPPPPEPDLVPSEYRADAEKLKELFPNWTVADIGSVLAEVGGDLSLAATRISEGHAEQWGTATRKKDKKAPAQAPTSPQLGAGAPRGARGGRGGPAAARGGARGGARGAFARGLNGHAKTDSFSNAHATSTPASFADPPAPAQDLSGWGADDTPVPAPAAATDGWGAAPGPDESAEPPVPATNGVHHSPAVAQAPVYKAPSKPANSKLSWAQIARAPEKPKQAPPPPVAAPEPVYEEPEPPAAWEEPTTVQSHVWEEPEPPAPTPVVHDDDGWVTTEHVNSLPPASVIPDSWEKPVSPPPQEEAAPAPVVDASGWISSPPPPSETTLASVTSTTTTTTTATTSISSPPPGLLPAKPATPSTRPNVPRGGSARFKNVPLDTPVIMPGGHGSPYAGPITERLGMQFGSLSLGGEEIAPDASPEPPAPEPKLATFEPPAPTPAPEPPVQQQAAPPPPPQQPAPPPAPVQQQPQPQLQPQTQPSHLFQPHQQGFQPLQQTLQQQQQQHQQHLQQPQPAPLQTQQPFASSQYAQPQQTQHAHHSSINASYGALDHHASQHSPFGAQRPHQLQQQDQHAYFQTPPPSAAQADQYGGFSPLGPGMHAGFGGQQGMGGGMGGMDYSGYGGAERFYDAYGQQAGAGSFGGRGNPLGQDDVAKGLSAAAQGAQQGQAPPTVPGSQVGAQQSQQQQQQQQQQSGQAAQQQQQPYAAAAATAYAHPYYNPYMMQTTAFYGQPAPGVGMGGVGYAGHQPYVKYAPTHAGIPPRVGAGMSMYNQPAGGYAFDDAYGAPQQVPDRFQQAPQQQPGGAQQPGPPPPPQASKAQDRFGGPDKQAGPQTPTRAQPFYPGAGAGAQGRFGPQTSAAGGSGLGGFGAANQSGVGLGGYPQSAAMQDQQQQAFYGGYQPRQQQQYWQ